MKIEQISEILKQCENASVEFKSSDVSAESLAKEIIAFANVSGGSIFCGVEDNGYICGLNLSKNFEEFVMNVVRNNINPPLEVDFELIDVDDKKKAWVIVPKGIHKPYQTIDGKYL